MSEEHNNIWDLVEDPSPESLIAAEFIPSIPEAHSEALEDLEKHVLDSEDGNADSYDIIKRILHTFKGDFGVMGLVKYVDLIHHIEELFLGHHLRSDTLLLLKDFLEKSFDFFREGKVPLVDDKVIVQIFEGHWEQFEKDPDRKEKIRAAYEDTTELDLKKELVALQAYVEEPELLQDFVVESGEQLQETGEILLRIQNHDELEDDINTLFRACHTFKGIAGFLNLSITQNYAHALENVLSLARKNEVNLEDENFDTVQASFDHLSQIIESFNEFLNTQEFHFPEGMAEVKAELVHISGSPDQELTSEPLASIDLDSASPDDVDAELERLIALNKKNDEQSKEASIEKSTEVKTEKPKVNSPAKAKKKNNAAEDTIRVGTKRLDLLIDNIGETVIAFSMLQADSNIKHANDLILEKKMAQADQLIRQLQEISMSLRMVPVNGTFQKMARIVRDLSKKLGKKVVFQTEGEDTELDKGVVEKIGDPLMHMVRNSLDHGVETKEERAETDKNPAATVTLRSYNKGGNIYIEIEDDGRGIPRDRILGKAVNLGLISQEDGDALSDPEVFRFIFHPGFSTAAQVTDISGRGVGMDVVKKNIEALRGSVSIQSTLGKGTLFSIRLPLTMAIIDGMVVVDGDEKFIIPTLNIVTTIGYTDENIIDTPQGETFVEIQEELIKVIELNSLLGFQPAIGTIREGVIIVVEDSVGGKLGLHVNDILGQQQIVIKGCGPWLGELDGISGGAIMNDGNVSLIVDIVGLMKLYMKMDKNDRNVLVQNVETI